MIKVAIICNINDLSGGSNQYQMRLLERLYNAELEKKGYEFIIVNPPPNFYHKKNKFCVSKKINFTVLDLVYQKISSPIFMSKFFRKLKIGNSRLEKFLMKLDVSYAYFLTPDFRSASFKEIPIILTVWDIGHRKLQDLDEFKKDFNFEYLENFYKKILPKSCLIFVDSKTTSCEIQRLYSLIPNKIINIGIGWSVSKKDYAASKKFVLPSKFQYIYYPANYWTHKNHFFILKVLREIVKTKPDIKLLLTGRDQLGYKLKVQQYIEELGLQEFVCDLGYLNEEQQAEVYRQVKCLVFPSLLGPTNIPPFEAALFGVPSILSPVHEKESYDINGIFIMKDYNILKWKNKILSVVDSQTNVEREFIDRIQDPISLIIDSFDKELNIQK
jgi:glycosyltransferase involved in cell wall biosynthesis